MRSLDEFYRYIEKQEQALREQAAQAAEPTTPAEDITAKPEEDAPGQAAARTAADEVAPQATVAPPTPDRPVRASVPPATFVPQTTFVPPPLPPKPARPSRYESILPPEVLRSANGHAAPSAGDTPLADAGPSGAGIRPADAGPSGASARPADDARLADGVRPAGDVRYMMRGGVTIPVPAEEASGVPDIEAYIPTLRDPDPPRDTSAPGACEEADASPADPQDYLPPIVEEQEPPLVVDAPARVAGDARPRRARRGEPAPPPDLSEGEAAALWSRLPRHIQLLVGMTEPQEEVAQKYYTRGFKESRRQLIERLLDPTLTLEDTARVLGVCPTTVRRYTNRGVLPHHRTVGQQRRFRLSDVLAFLEQSPKSGPARKAGGSEANDA